MGSGVMAGDEVRELALDIGEQATGAYTEETAVQPLVA
jgi:hypothetical protein